MLHFLVVCLEVGQKGVGAVVVVVNYEWQGLFGLEIRHLAGYADGEAADYESVLREFYKLRNGVGGCGAGVAYATGAQTERFGHG